MFFSRFKKTENKKKNFLQQNVFIFLNLYSYPHEHFLIDIFYKFDFNH